MCSSSIESPVSRDKQLILRGIGIVLALLWIRPCLIVRSGLRVSRVGRRILRIIVVIRLAITGIRTCLRHRLAIVVWIGPSWCTVLLRWSTPSGLLSSGSTPCTAGLLRISTAAGVALIRRVDPRIRRWHVRHIHAVCWW